MPSVFIVGGALTRTGFSSEVTLMVFGFNLVLFGARDFA